MTSSLPIRATSGETNTEVSPVHESALGMTFARFEVAFSAERMTAEQLRVQYREMMGVGPVSGGVRAVRTATAGHESESARSGEPLIRAADPLGCASAIEHRAAPHPVVRHVRDGELIKFVQRRPDGLEIESVVVPMRRGGQQWFSLCVSSQVGCAMGCTFCETAQLGLLAQLSAAEIVGQIVAARREFGADVRNIVFMGMGEPFDNFDAVADAVRVLNDPMGLSIGMSRVTISTVGRVRGIRRLAALGWRRINLAVSLNAPNDEIRSRIMPVNRGEPMAELREALAAYPLRKCQFIMVEYVLIPGVNDAPEHAGELAAYLRPLRCGVNVIPYNPRLGSPWPAPAPERVQAFLGWLQDAGQFCKLRITKGREYMAACGQLGNRELRNKLRM